MAVVGAGLTAVAFAPLLWLGPSWTPWLLAGPLALAGCGLALQATALEAAPSGDAGMASGTFSTSRYLGSSVGSAALGALASALLIPRAARPVPSVGLSPALSQRPDQKAAATMSTESRRCRGAERAGGRGGSPLP